MAINVWKKNENEIPFFNKEKGSYLLPVIING